MRALVLLLIIAVGASQMSYAKDKPAKSRAAEQLGVKLGTDFQFNPLSVGGKYQSPSEGLVVVENEKMIGDILDYRRSYSDRIEKTRRTEARK